MKTTIITVLAASTLLAGCGGGTTSTPAAAVPGAGTAGTAATGTASTAAPGPSTSTTGSGTTATKPGASSTKPKKGRRVAKGKSVGSASKTGKKAFVTLKETIKDPSTIKLKVTLRPAQKTKVMWTMSCKKGSDSRVGGANYEVSKSSSQTLDQPLSGGKSCTVSALGQLTKRGTIKLEVLG